MNLRGIIVAIAALVFSCSAQAINFGQLNDFQDGTIQNWTNGGSPGAPPVVNLDGGPAGMGDRYIQVTSLGGGGPGSRLTVYNEDDWLGDYFHQGIMAIEVDLKNFGNTQLSIRLGFLMEDLPSSSGYLSDPAFILPVGSGWQHATFLITPATMTPVGTPDDFNTFFTSSIIQVRFINEVGNTNLNGDPIVAQLGVDNIHAVPEPGSYVLSMVGLIAIVAAQRCRGAKRASLK